MEDSIPAPPAKPLVVYDGDCSFCRYWIGRWKNLTQGRVEYVPYQLMPDPYMGVGHAQFRQAVYLLTAYGQRLRGAEAVAVLLKLSGYPSSSWLYYRLPLASKAAEAGYHFVANRRDFFYRLTQLFFRYA